MIRSTGVFLDVSVFTAFFTIKFKERMQDGLLYLRDIGDDGETQDLPILREWKSARALLLRYKAAASPLLNGAKAELGKVWIESLPGNCGTPWRLEEDDYAQAHIRTRTALIAAPDAFTFSGPDKVLLGPGVVNLVEHRVLHSDVNPSHHARVHLIVDVKRPEPDGE